MASDAFDSIFWAFVHQNHWSFVMVDLGHVVSDKALSSLLAWSLLGLELYKFYLSFALATHVCIITLLLFLLARALQDFVGC